MRNTFIRRMFSIVCLLIACACTSPGAAEFDAYKASFDTAFETGQSVLDRVAVKERETFGISLPPVTPSTVYFDPSEARYFADNVDPPGTASLRKTLRIVKLYNESLSGLASGESSKVIAGRMTEIGTTAVSIGLQVSTPLSAQQKGITASLAERTKPLAALEPITSLAFGSLTREEFRKQVLAQSGTIDAILLELIEMSGNRAGGGAKTAAGAGGRACAATTVPSIFCLMIAPKLLGRKNVSGWTPFTADDVKEINATRSLLANWVVLLTTTRESLNSAVEAVRTGRRSGSSTEILANAIELDVAARGVRTALAK